MLAALTLYALEQENASPNIKAGGQPTISIENKTNEDFIVYGDFTVKASLLKKDAHIQLTFTQDIHKTGPELMFVRPNDLILYANHPDMVEKVLHTTEPKVQRLGTVLAAHVKKHVYFMLEAVSGLRKGFYKAVAGDRITLEPGDVAQVVGKTDFPHKFRLKMING
jgi:hypothetical protein